MTQNFKPELLPDMNPWQTLLNEIKRSAYTVEWIDNRINHELQQETAALDNMDLHGMDPGQLEKHRLANSKNIRTWLDQSRDERRHMTQIAGKAVSLGLSERYIESVRAEAGIIMRVVARTLEAAGLPEESYGAAMAELKVAFNEVRAELENRAASVALPVRPEG